MSCVYTIYGFEGCRFFMNALQLLKQILVKNPKHCKVVVKVVPYSEWQKLLNETHTKYKNTKNHKTSPLILKDAAYLGGHDNLVEYIKKNKLL